MKSIISKVLVSLLSIGLVAGTMFLEERFAAAEVRPAAAEVIRVLEKGAGASFQKKGESYDFSAGSSGRLAAALNNNAILRFEPDSEGSLSVSKITLKSGRLWVNTLASPLILEVESAGSTAKLFPGIFDVSADGGKLEVAAHRHFADIYSGKGGMTVTEGSGTKKKDAWVAANAADDDKFLLEIRMKAEADIRKRGPVLGKNGASVFSKLGKVFSGITSALDFMPSGKSDGGIDGAFNFFDAAVFAQLIGDKELASVRLQEFIDEAQQLSQEARQSPRFKTELESRKNAFAFASPDSKFFTARSSLRRLSESSPFESLNQAFADLLDAALAASDDGHKKTFEDIMRKFSSLVTSSQSALRKPESQETALFLRTRFQSFLETHPRYYSPENLKILNIFEEAVISGFRQGEEADEFRISFIAEKIKILKALNELMQKEEILFLSARKGFIALNDEIQSLRSGLADTGAFAEFDADLDAFAEFLSFLRSSNADQVKGNFAEPFEEFKKRQQEFAQVSELLGKASGGEQISGNRREELAAVVAADFGEIPATGIKITLPENEDDTRVRIIAASFEGKSFTGMYDTTRKVLSDIVFDAEKLSNPIRLKDIKNIFLLKLGKLEFPGGGTADAGKALPEESVSESSLLEKVAKSKFIAELAKLEVTVDEKLLDFADFESGVIHVSIALLGEGSEAKAFSFDVSEKASVVSELKVKTVQGEIPVNDTFALRELPLKVEQVYQRAVFEKQKDEELEKFAETGEIEE